MSVDEYKGNITVSSDGATSITIPLTGYVIKPAPTVHVADFQASAAVPPCSTIKVTWTNPEGGSVPDSYLVLASKNGYDNIAVPIDGQRRNNTTYSKNIDGINKDVVFNQLEPLTTYYFKIYPYNNTDSDILYYTGGEVPQAEAKTRSEPVTFIFWDFNEEIFDEGTSNWVQSINSVVNESNGIFTAKGLLTHEFDPAVSYNGDTANGLTGTGAGKSFVPQGGTKDTETDKFYNNEKSFELAIPTTGYANIGLSYAIQRTRSGFTSNLIEYSVNGGDSYIEHSTLTDIPAEFATRGFDFSDIPEANNNPDFKIKITLDGASAYDGNNRFDNIRITGSEICTYDTGIPIPLTDGPTVTMIDGRANDSNAAMPPIPNASDNQYVLKLALLDEGPWTVELESGLNFCAYYWGTEWQTVDKTGNSFLITVSKQRSGNDLFIVLSDKNPTLPVELSSFMVALNSNGNPVVTWETQTETGVNGFYIYRGVNKNLGEAILISSLVPATNSSLEHSYSFVDTELTEEGTYYYWLNVSDLNGQQSYHGPAELNFTFSEEEDTPEVVYTTALRSIYPNPFNPNANIGFELAESSEVAISVYNARGQLVRSFAPFTHGAGYGSIVWDGKDEGGSSVSSGIYLFRMTVGAKSFSAKALMLK